MKTFTTKIGSSARLVYPHKLMARRRLTIMVSSFILERFTLPKTWEYHRCKWPFEGIFTYKLDFKFTACGNSQ